MKKIEETKKKTRELQDLQNKNDNKVLIKRREEENRQARLEAERQALQKRKANEKQQQIYKN